MDEKTCLKTQTKVSKVKVESVQAFYQDQVERAKVEADRTKAEVKR